MVWTPESKDGNSQQPWRQLAVLALTPEMGGSSALLAALIQGINSEVRRVCVS